MLKFPLAACPAPLARTYWVVENLLLAGAYAGHTDPAAHQQRLQGLFRTGIRTVVNLMEADEVSPSGKPFTPYEDKLSLIAQEAGQHVDCLRFPIVDGSITTIPSMRQILDAIDRSLAAQRPCYVHCFGGIGRTGTVVCCWLLRHDYANPDDVFKILQTLRIADSARAAWTAPETDAQREFVLQWKD